MKARVGLFPILVAVILCSAPTAGAGTDPELADRGTLKKLSLEELFDLEVTSVSSKPEPVSEAAAAVRVVTGDDIRRMGALSIAEALRYIPGIEVARVDSRQYAITARGFNGTVANKLLVLIDGRSVYTPLFSGVFWEAQDVFLEDVEQIEVIRGPGATVWGANAVNGVINVISKPARDTQGLLVTGGGGNGERGFGGLRYGRALGQNAFVRVYGKGFQRDASLRPNGQKAGDEFTMGQGGFRADWTPATANAITLQGDVYGGAIDQPASDDQEISGGNVLARWAHHFSPLSDLQLNVYYDRTNRTIPNVFDEGLDTYDATLRHRLAVGGAHDIVWGLGYRQSLDVIRNSPGLAFLPDHLKRRVFSGFVQDEITLAENRLVWTLGSKVEHNDYTGVEYQPSTRLAWTPAAKQTVWAAISRAVRTPSRIDRDLFVPASPPYFLAGGPDFDSEVLRAFELGYRVQPSPRVTASLASFYDSYDKLRTLEPGSPAFLANGMDGNSHGVEASADVQAREWWRVSGGYAYLKLELSATPGSADTTSVKQTGDSPRNQWYLRSSVTLPHDLALDVGIRSVGKLPHQGVPSYIACDGRFGWQPTKEVEIALVGSNLFEPQHPEFGTAASRREVARSLYGKVTCRF
ncbi:MAG TPA: TonB-dependent receptor [Candidatus Limnocylindrales bacterium]|nr:TonB-dependent receptor [Candidatus Limnocylindrales bacterium]